MTKPASGIVEIARKYESGITVPNVSNEISADLNWMAKEILWLNNQHECEWQPAETAPKEWEGTKCWIYNPSTKKVYAEHVAIGYSRHTNHCGGYYFMPYSEPAAPKEPNQC